MTILRPAAVREALVRLGVGLIVSILAGNVVLVARHAPIAQSAAAQDAPAAQPAAEPDEEPCTPAPLQHRAAQVLVVGLPGVLTADEPLARQVLRTGVAGVLLTKTNVEDADQVRELVWDLRLGARTPLLVATDEEPGRVSSFGALIGRTSSARTLARRMDPEQVRDFAAQLGRELASFGIDLDLAPVADLDDGPAEAIIGDRAFSAEPDVASAYALAFSHGLSEVGVLPAAKHFPGHGPSRADSHRRLATVDVDVDELLDRDVVPFVAQIRTGVPVIMTGHVAYEGLDPDLPASLSPATYDLLRDLGFSGVAITDSIGMGAVNLRWDFPDAAVMAIAAGADAVLATDGSKAPMMRNALVRAVVTGALPEARLNEAVARMYRLRGLDPTEVVCLDVEFPAMEVPPRLRVPR